MKVSIIGTGYVGLVTGVCLAKSGHEVHCVDTDARKVDAINKAIPPIYEAGLAELLAAHAGHNLKATTDLHRAVCDTDLTIIAVGTPFDGREIDLAQIRTAASQIGAALRAKPGYHTVVVKSTVVPGTTDTVVLPLLEAASGKKAGRDFGVAMNPEFLREGEAINDFLHPDRLVLGGIDERSLAALDELYSVFPGITRVHVDTRTAELIKYTSNALLATLISFSNEIGNLSASIGVDVVDVMRGVHLDRRLMPALPDGRRITPAFLSYLAAGCGFGGSCFPKDIRALIAFGENAGTPMGILRSVMTVNERQPSRMLALLGARFPSLQGVRVGVLGMAFKPGTDDIRESPAIEVTRMLLAQGAVVSAFDPIATREAAKLFGNEVQFFDSVEAIASAVDALVIMTGWPEFARIPQVLSGLRAPPLVIDGRRMLDKASVPAYFGIGLRADPSGT